MVGGRDRRRCRLEIVSVLVGSRISVRSGIGPLVASGVALGFEVLFALIALFFESYNLMTLALLVLPMVTAAGIQKLTELERGEQPGAGPRTPAGVELPPASGGARGAAAGRRGAGGGDRLR